MHNIHQILSLLIPHHPLAPPGILSDPLVWVRYLLPTPQSYLDTAPFLLPHHHPPSNFLSLYLPDTYVGILAQPLHAADLPSATRSAEAAEQTGADTADSSLIVAATAAPLVESSGAEEEEAAAVGGRLVRNGWIAVGAVAAAMAAL